MKLKHQFVLLLATLLLTACSSDMLSIFFDIPPPTTEELARERARAAAKLRAQQNRVIVDAKPEPKKLPPHELAGKLAVAENWQQAMNLLPADSGGQPDWLAAMDNNIIQPRSHMGTDVIDKPVFTYDFYIKGETSLFDAWFPHSSHTRLLDCASCHPGVFKYRATKMSMKEIRAGRYCGSCHGKVAFSVDASCNRCHTGMPGGG